MTNCWWTGWETRWWGRERVDHLNVYSKKYFNSPPKDGDGGGSSERKSTNTYHEFLQMFGKMACLLTYILVVDEVQTCRVVRSKYCCPVNTYWLCTYLQHAFSSLTSDQSSCLWCCVLSNQFSKWATFMGGQSLIRWMKLCCFKNVVCKIELLVLHAHYLHFGPNFLYLILVQLDPWGTGVRNTCWKFGWFGVAGKRVNHQ